MIANANVNANVNMSQSSKEVDSVEIIKRINAISPLDEYRFYGRLPWKMITHIFLVIFTAAQAMITLSLITDYCRSQERVFYDSFIYNNKSKEHPDYPRRMHLYSVSQLRKHINDSLYKFEMFSNNSLEYTGNYEHILQMEVDYNTDMSKINESSISIMNDYNISYGNLGPFNESYSEYDIKKFISFINAFKIKYEFNTLVPIYFQEHRECFGWKVYQIFDISKHAHFEITLDIQRSICQEHTELSKEEIFLVKFQWIHIIVIVLSVLNCLFSILSLRNKVSNQTAVKNIISRTLTIKDFVDKWIILSIFGNICQCTGGILGLIDTENKYKITGLVVGSGCLFGFICSCSYFDYNDDYSMLHEVMKTAFPNLIKFFVGLLPLFFGFVICGRCIFFKSERFKSILNSSLTLFSISNGDAIFDIIMDISKIHVFLGQVFSYVFCIYFIVIILNTFISIIQKAYVHTKMKKGRHWIFTYIREDPKLAQAIQFRKAIKFKDQENVVSEDVEHIFNERIVSFAEKVNLCNKLLEQITEIQNESIKKDLLDYFEQETRTIPDIRKKSLFEE